MRREATWALNIKDDDSSTAEAASAAVAADDQRAFMAFLDRCDAAASVHRHRLELEALGHPGVTAPTGSARAAAGREVSPQGADAESLHRRADILRRSALDWKDALAESLSRTRRLLLLDNRYLMRFVQACDEPIRDEAQLVSPSFSPISLNSGLLDTMTTNLLPYVLLW
jgi:hypothetical protein